MKILQNIRLWGMAGFLFTFQLCWGQDYKLEQKFVKGEVIRYKRTIHTQVVAESLPGSKRETIKEYYLTRKVEEVYPDGTAEVIQTQDSVITKVNQERVPNTHEEAMNGVAVLMKISKTRAYQEIRALNEVPPEAQTIFENMQQNLQNQPGLPAKALSIGESWNDDTVFLQNHPCCGRNYDHTVTQRLTSTLLGLGNDADMDCAKVQFSGTMAGMEQNCSFTSALNGRIQGTKVFNYKTGKEIKTTTYMDVVINSANSEDKMEYKETIIITEELLK